MQAFIGNQSTCLKILPQQIQTIVDLICVLQENGGAEYLDLLNAIVKVEGLGLTLKRNQAYVMKYVMQDYNKLAGIMDQPREDREQILTLKTDVQQLRYLISLVDLLATCAEASQRVSLSPLTRVSNRGVARIRCGGHKTTWYFLTHTK